MDLEDPDMSAALESLITESGSSPVTRIKILGKRPIEKEHLPASSKISRSSTDSSLTSHQEPNSGSVISLTDTIRNNRYSDNNAGPFDVHVQRISNPKAQLHPIFVGRAVCELGISDILEIKKAGFSKASIYFKTKEAANALVNDRKLSEKDLKAFIPPFRTSRKGIIRDVPPEFTDQQILESIVSPFKVIAVSRLNRRITTPPYLDSQSDPPPAITYSPSLSVSITFEGQKIPKHIYLFHVSYPVSPYVARVSRCNKCYRFGHIKTNCKSQPRCSHCGEKGHSFSEEHCHQSHRPPTCANCKGEHRADSFICPEFLTQKEIRKYAAYRNISLLDAREIFKGNRTPPSFSSSSEMFPKLNSSCFTSRPPDSNPRAPSSPPLEYTSPHLSFAQAAKTLSSSSSPHSSPLCIPAPDRASCKSSPSLPALTRHTHVTRLNKKPRLPPSPYRPPHPYVSFPAPLSTFSNVSVNHSDNPHTPSTSSPPSLPITPQNALNHILRLIIDLLPLLTSSDFPGLAPTILQFIRNLPANLDNSPPPPPI
ncbi:hypothetical protein EAG_11378 [Camponotus floridanus]|uniref:CCHC-type domain-containing protein n=1 Tax=Camponotus floridanus TaxID=104421 RepID=E2ACL4_CAMFO|nr:hypothetical protein EAG_11378 [Camponotus floridanus]